jgi:hypothetical protein
MRAAPHHQLAEQVQVNYLQRRRRRSSRPAEHVGFGALLNHAPAERFSTVERERGAEGIIIVHLPHAHTAHHSAVGITQYRGIACVVPLVLLAPVYLGHSVVVGSGGGGGLALAGALLLAGAHT